MSLISLIDTFWRLHAAKGNNQIGNVYVFKIHHKQETVTENKYWFAIRCSESRELNKWQSLLIHTRGSNLRDWENNDVPDKQTRRPLGLTAQSPWIELRDLLYPGRAPAGTLLLCGINISGNANHQNPAPYLFYTFPCGTHFIHTMFYIKKTIP